MSSYKNDLQSINVRVWDAQGNLLLTDYNVATKSYYDVVYNAGWEAAKDGSSSKRVGDSIEVHIPSATVGEFTYYSYALSGSVGTLTYNTGNSTVSGDISITVNGSTVTTIPFSKKVAIV